MLIINVIQFKYQYVGVEIQFMKEILLYILIVFLFAGLFSFCPKYQNALKIPHLANSQFLLIISGNLQQHQSLKFYEKVYLFNDDASINTPTIQPIRLIKREEEMSGIIYTYPSLEFSTQSINQGFMDIANLNRFLDKVIFVPVYGKKCLGDTELRANGDIYCKIQVTSSYLIKKVINDHQIAIQTNSYEENYTQGALQETQKNSNIIQPELSQEIQAKMEQNQRQKQLQQQQNRLQQSSNNQKQIIIIENHQQQTVNVQTQKAQVQEQELLNKKQNIQQFHSQQQTEVKQQDIKRINQQENNNQQTIIRESKQQNEATLQGHMQEKNIQVQKGTQGIEQDQKQTPIIKNIQSITSQAAQQILIKTQEYKNNQKQIAQAELQINKNIQAISLEQLAQPVSEEIKVEEKIEQKLNQQFDKNAAQSQTANIQINNSPQIIQQNADIEEINYKQLQNVQAKIEENHKNEQISQLLEAKKSEQYQRQNMEKAQSISRQQNEQVIQYTQQNAPEMHEFLGNIEANQQIQGNKLQESNQQQSPLSQMIAIEGQKTQENISIEKIVFQEVPQSESQINELLNQQNLQKIAELQQFFSTINQPNPEEQQQISQIQYNTQIVQERGKEVEKESEKGEEETNEADETLEEENKQKEEKEEKAVKEESEKNEEKEESRMQITLNENELIKEISQINFDLIPQNNQVQPMEILPSLNSQFRQKFLDSQALFSMRVDTQL